MEHRITPLIAERAPWLYKLRGAYPVRRCLEWLLGLNKTTALAQSLAAADHAEIMGRMANLIAHNLTVRGFDNIPVHGPALIVSNHPTGIADGIILHHLIAQRRKDCYFFANKDILRILPQMDGMIAPVEWRHDKRNTTSSKETLKAFKAATASGRIGVIFPSGRLAKRRGLRLYERPWMTSAAALARKHNLPVVPVNIQARNSALFYLLDLLHPTLRDITLFHETLNKDRQPFRVTIGQPVQPSALPSCPEAGTALLRDATLSLSHNAPKGIGMIETTRPLWTT